MPFLRLVTGLRLPARLGSFCGALAIVCLSWCGDPQLAWAAQATATTLSLTSGGNAASSVAAGTVVTLTATVKRSTSGATGVPTGTVSFTVEGITLDTVKVNGSGVATLTASSAGISAGSYPIKAVYNGDASDVTSTSTAVTVTVK